MMDVSDKTPDPARRCIECSRELQPDDKFCSACGTRVDIKKDVYEVSPDGLVEKIKEVVRDVRVKKVVIKDGDGKVLLSMPVTWGAAGTLAIVALAPWLAAVGVIAGLVTRCTVEVERTEK